MAEPLKKHSERDKMGKKKNKFKNLFKKLKYQYTRTEFISAVCRKCELCRSISNPEYCYDTVYVNDPKKFMKVILKQLIHFSENSFDYLKCDQNVIHPDEWFKEIFQTSFCNSNHCSQLPQNGNQCEHFAGCLYAFKKQVRGTAVDTLTNMWTCPKIPHYVPSNMHKYSHIFKQATVVRNPTPTFFCNQEFGEEIRSILDGNND
jgi:hypothetical protein